MSSFKAYFITTAIPYVNSKPHIGHAQEFILADSLARYYRSQGQRVVFQSGTDDNATKNVLAAKAAGLSVKEFVDLNADKFESLLTFLDAKPDLFVRTASEKHFTSVDRFLRGLNREDLYTSSYSGLYCSGCEDFYNEQDLVNGLCPDHLKKPEHIEESNTFFRLSKYQQKIAELIESDTIKITPSSKKKEILSFVNQGLSDISLSRSAARTQGWGIPFPDKADQTVYVWIDALINYVSGDPKNWAEDIYKVHVIGKNVWKFHAVYWPALLLSAGLSLPNEIVVHGFLTNEGTKISKSLGNGIDPLDIISRYGVDAFRFYLLGVLSFEQDADFVEQNLLSSYNSELANKLGNLVSRVLTLGKDLDLQKKAPEQLKVEYKDLRKDAFERIGHINSQINTLKPWELLKSGDSNGELRGYLSEWVGQLSIISRLLEPLVPEGAGRLSQLLVDRKNRIEQLYPRR
ncbi:Methionine--tRNA ligase [compost metagenome]